MKNEKKIIPYPIGVLLYFIVMSFGLLFGGGMILYTIIDSGKISGAPFWETALAYILLITGVYFLVEVIKQIKLRIKWNKENNVETKETKLTTEEANMYQTIMPDPTYHNDAIDKASGIKYEAALKTDKYGNTYFKSKTRYGGFYYIGSLIVSLALTLLIIVCIVNFIKNNA